MRFELDNPDAPTYTCHSDSGKTYRISYAGSGDADPDFVALWKCDCPAGQHGRNCRHLTAFLTWLLGHSAERE